MQEVCDWCDGEGCDECHPDVGMSKDCSSKDADGDVEITGAVLSCDWCDGLGNMDGETCDECDGTGKVNDRGGSGCLDRAASGGWGDMKEADDGDLTTSAKTSHPKPYKLVTDEEIDAYRKSLEEQASAQLGVTLDEAECILKAFSWNSVKMMDEWYANRDETREKVRVFPPLDTKSAPQQIQCASEFCDEVSKAEADVLSCGHWFCGDCWTGHLESRVSYGSECVYATCPGFECKTKKCKHRAEDECKCQILVPEKLVEKYVSKESFEKYKRWVRDAFIEHHQNLRWCANNACSRVSKKADVDQRALLDDDMEGVDAEDEILCACGHQYCFKCGLDAHQPVPCDLAKSFLALDQTDMLTQKLIAAITKDCPNPNCNVKIEKNGACVHMTCKKCRWDFCWLCKKPWKGHGGGYYNCKEYSEQVEKGKLSKEQEDIRMNQAMLSKYRLYREQFDKERELVKTVIKKRIEVEEAPQDQKTKGFLIESLTTLAEAPRLLQWSFCLTYYLKESKEQKLFIHQQQQLTELVHEIVDKCMGWDVPTLCEKRMDIINWTKSIDKHRRLTLQNLEAGQLVEVILNEADEKTNDDNWACNNCYYINKPGLSSSSSSSDKDKEKEKKEKKNKCSRCGACRLHGERECYGCMPKSWG